LLLIGPGELELARAATPAGQGTASEPTTLDAALAEFEKDLLQRLYQEYPSTRRLATRLGTSHSAIAKRLRRYAIGGAEK
jgi:TyrR family helix-turn-helix protein